MCTLDEFMDALRPYLRDYDMTFILLAAPQIHRQLDDERRLALLRTNYKLDRCTKTFIKDIQNSSIASLKEGINPSTAANGQDGPTDLTESRPDQATALKGIVHDWYTSGPKQLPPPIVLLFICHRVQNFAAFGGLNKMYEDCSGKNEDVEKILRPWYRAIGTLQHPAPQRRRHLRWLRG